MRAQLQALQAEFLKTKHSGIVRATFLAFALIPLMGSVFILIIQNQNPFAPAGSLAAKAKAMNFEPDWTSYLSLLTQAVGIGGILAFGFIASWIFGREYSEGTAKDLLALPISRTMIANAKFIVYVLWCLALVVANLLAGLLIGTLLQLPLIQADTLFSLLTHYFITTIMTIVIDMPIALIAVWGRGYLAPLGFVALTLVFAQVIAAAGYGSYFPWSIPGLYSGVAKEYRNLLDHYSYFILILTGIAGYFGTIMYWKTADQSK